jgi:hypothetical protein
MTLSELTLPVPYADCKDLAMVYHYEVAVLWYTIQQEHGDPRHVATARQLTDGRWMLNGDLLSELYPGGIIGWAVEYLTPEIMAQIEVVPLADALALLLPESPSPVN